MTTYANGKRIRYPHTHDWVRRVVGDLEERGLVTCVDEDGCVSVEYDDGDGIIYQPDVLVLHRSGWYWMEPPEETTKGWG